VSRLYADLLRAEAHIRDLEARLAKATHDAVVARDRADLAEGILRKVLTDADVEVVEYGPGRPDMAGRRYLGLDYSAIDLTDAQAALLDTIINPEETPGA
jgi:hypothetical protein